MKHIPGPDFPTGGIIIGKNIIKKVINLEEDHSKLEEKLILNKQKMAEKD